MKTLTTTDIDLKEIDDLIRFARAYCAEKLPWFSPALFQCQIELTSQVPLAAIDQHLNIYFNPEAIQKIANTGDLSSTLSQLGFVWIHEISHVLREHGERAKAQSARHGLWNIAADLEINDSQWKGLTPPKPYPLLYPEQYDLPTGQITEFYYQKLIEREEAKKKKDSKKQKGDNNQSDDTTNNKDDSAAPNEGNPQPPNDASNPATDEQNTLPDNYPDEGSGVHGQSRDWEIEQEMSTEDSEILRPSKQKKEELEVEMIRKSVARAINEHKSEGDMPGGWERWAEDLLQPTVNWKQILKHRMSVAINKGIGSRIDYTYSRPSRRQASHPSFVLPALQGDVSAKIAIVVDTSASINDKELSRIMGEVMGVLRLYQLPVTVIPCDAKAYAPIELVVPSDLFKLKKMPGGGGTNMVIGIEAALGLKPRPDSILVLTDGFTPYPKQLYKVPVLFGILKIKNRFTRRPPNPPWRKDLVVEIEL